MKVFGTFIFLNMYTKSFIGVVRIKKRLHKTADKALRNIEIEELIVSLVIIMLSPNNSIPHMDSIGFWVIENKIAIKPKNKKKIGPLQIFK